MGAVQAGKFTAIEFLIAAALDMGFRSILVLASQTNTLRGQAEGRTVSLVGDFNNELHVEESLNDYVTWLTSSLDTKSGEDADVHQARDIVYFPDKILHLMHSCASNTCKGCQLEAPFSLKTKYKKAGHLLQPNCSFPAMYKRCGSKPCCVSSETPRMFYYAFVALLVYCATLFRSERFCNLEWHCRLSGNCRRTTRCRLKRKP